jgi:hypothetical protein
MRMFDVVGPLKIVDAVTGESVAEGAVQLDETVTNVDALLAGGLIAAPAAPKTSASKKNDEVS